MQISRMITVGSLLFLLTSCVVGEIRDHSFYLEDDFTVQLLNEDWHIIRQTKDPFNPKAASSRDKIAFAHKKSNGYISANSFILSDVSQARPLSVHVDAAVSNWRGMKLSEKQTRIDGIDAVEVVISSTRMVKWVFMKKGDRGYELVYSNTPAYFDEYIGVFDKFVESFKTL